MFYDDENRLVTAQFYTSWKTDFVYDGLGRLRKRIEYVFSGGLWTVSSTTYYHYDGMRVIQERQSNPTVSYTRGTDLSGSLEGAGGIGGLLARSHGYASSNGNFYTHNFYHADGNGNVTYLVNSSQSLAASYRYDPYGNTISSSGSLASANVYRFSSKEFHVNSGLYYYGYRWYAPNLQRWLNRDPSGELSGINLYGFVFSDPLIKYDPNGLLPGWMQACGSLGSWLGLGTFALGAGLAIGYNERYYRDYYGELLEPGESVWVRSAVARIIGTAGLLDLSSGGTVHLQISKDASGKVTTSYVVWYEKMPLS